MSTAIDGPHWPPRSPYEALLASPNGRKKAEQRQRQISPSPSPLKRSATTPNLRGNKGSLSSMDENEDEDEETLQLRLATLEARLKLKKLQAKKAKLGTSSSDAEPVDTRPARPPTRATSVLSSRRETTRSNWGTARSDSSATLEVPVSPERKQIPAEKPRSPGRVLLGIDKGLSGKNVSLRRAPGLRTAPAIRDDPFLGDLRLPKSQSTTALLRESVRSRENAQNGQKSFSQRIAEIRRQDKDNKEQKERSTRLRKQRSTGFGISQEEIDQFKATSEHDDAGKRESQPHFGQNQREFSRAEVMKAVSRPPGGLIQRSTTASGVRNSRLQENSSTVTLAESIQRPRSSVLSRTAVSLETQSSLKSPPSIDQPSVSRPQSLTAGTELFETYSSTYLSRRILPHSFVARTLKSKKPVLIPELLRDIKSPNFSLPQSLEESDFVVFGVIASKSSPLAHKDSHRANPKPNSSSLAEAADSETNTRGKYMVFTLTDLKWTLDLYLFTTAYTRFWKLTPGTMIAILNPSIMPPPPGKADTGRWSMVLNSSDDTVLEIGTARDLGFCKAVKKDGKTCSTWINKSKTEYCEWHVDQAVERNRRGRMEVQGMSAPFAPGGKSNGRIGMFGSRRGRDEKEVEGEGLLKEGKQYDRSTQSTYFLAPSLGREGPMALLDAEDQGPGRGMSKEERLRKRLAEREKEKEIARKLGGAGTGTGAEYLRLQHGFDAERKAAQAEERPEVDAEGLGLLGNQAVGIHLSPLKRKKTGDERALPRKKTRFVTEKGIREAGRDSFGVVNASPDEEDDLDIV